MRPLIGQQKSCRRPLLRTVQIVQICTILHISGEMPAILAVPVSRYSTLMSTQMRDQRLRIQRTRGRNVARVVNKGVFCVWLVIAVVDSEAEPED